MGSKKEEGEEERKGKVRNGKQKKEKLRRKERDKETPTSMSKQ